MNKQEQILFEELIKDREESSRAIKKKSMRGVEETVVQKYSEKAHFIHELLQNADDCNATEVHFELGKNGLRFWHNGNVQFSIISPTLENDENYKGPNGHINAIVAIGNSSKGSSTEYKIGKFGVGFKAVFQYTSTPYIYDDNFSFYIKDLIVPVLLDEDNPQRKKGETLFFFPFNNPNISPEKAYDEIAYKLQNLQYPLLFLNHIENLYWSIGDSNGKYSQLKESLSEVDVDVKKVKQVFNSSVLGTSHIQRLILFTEKEPEKNLDYCVGFFLNDRSDKIVAKSMPVYCFFPTAKDSGLNFIVHAPFSLIDNREGLSENDWNDKLRLRLAKLAASSLTTLCELNLVGDDLFDVIPYKSMRFLFNYDFYEEFEKVLKTQSVIPCQGGGYVSAEHAYWPSSTTVTEFLPLEQLRSLVDDEEARWVFVKNNYKALNQNNKELAEYLNRIIKDDEGNWLSVDGHYIKVKHRLDESAIFTLFRKSFIESQPTEWLHLFYRYLLNVESSRKDVKTKPIFLNKDSKAVAAFRYDSSSRKYENILFVDTVEGSTMPTLLPKLLENETTREFVKEFGIGKPNMRDEIYNDIIPMYKGDADFDRIQHFRRFYEYFKVCPNEDKNSYLDLIRSVEFINAVDITDGGWPNGEPYFCRPNEVYFPTDELLEYFSNSEESVFFLSEDKLQGIYEEEGKENVDKFLLELGVKKHLRVTEKGWFFCREKAYRDEIKEKNYITSSSRYITDYSFPMLEEKMSLMTKKSSLEIWNSLLCVMEENNGSCFEGKHGKYDRFTSSLMWMLTNYQWLYSKDGNVCTPGQVTVDDLDNQYNTSNPYAVALGVKIKLKTERVTVDDVVNEALKFLSDEEIIRVLREATSRKQYGKIGESKEDCRLDREYEMKRETIGDREDNDDFQEEKPDEEDKEQGILFDYDPVKIEKQIRDKLEVEIKLKGNRKELIEAINTCKRYSYEWFLNYIALMGTYSEKLSPDNRATMSFSSIEAEKDSDRFFLLDGANKFIPEGISESDGSTIRLWYNGDNVSDKINIEGVSRLGQKLQILTKTALPKPIIDKLPIVTRVEFQYTPVIDLVNRLLRAFQDKGNIDPWSDIKESLPSIQYIYGPPGTGKTWTIGQTIEEITLGNKAGVLVLTPTNTAADEVCKKLLEGDRHISSVRLSGVTSRELEEKGVFYTDNLTVSEVERVPVVASTIHRLPYFELGGDEERNSCRLFQYPWDYVIFDESSMIGLHYIVFAIMSIFKSNKDVKFIVAGDPMQIPPIVEINDDELENFEVQDENIYKMMGVSSFDNTECEIRFIDSINNLDIQRRSVPAIGQLYSDLSYSSLLKHFRTEDSQKELPTVFKSIMKTAVTFVDMPLVKTVDSFRVFKLHGSSYHFYSAIMVMEFLKQFDIENGKEKNQEWSIGLISPYKAQAVLMDKLVSSYGFSSRIKIVSDTVHGFQGGECDIVIFVCNPNGYGMMKQNNKLKDKCLLFKQYIYNVAISRARDYLVVIHPFSWIQYNPFINRIINSYAKHNGSCEYLPYKELEYKLFREMSYVRDHSYVTSHDSVNIYNAILGKNYILKYSSDTLDVQVS